MLNSWGSGLYTVVVGEVRVAYSFLLRRSRHAPTHFARLPTKHRERRTTLCGLNAGRMKKVLADHLVWYFGKIQDRNEQFNAVAQNVTCRNCVSAYAAHRVAGSEL